MNDIITLTAQDGEDIDFYHIADVKHRSKNYAILQPVKLLDGMSSDEALVFQVTYGSGGTNNYNIELNDKIVDAVFKKYNKQTSSNYTKGGSFTPGDSLYSNDRPLGAPVNMLLDLAVFPFLLALLVLVSEFANGDGFFPIFMLFATLAAIATNAIYLVVHFFAFLFGKR